MQWFDDPDGVDGPFGGEFRLRPRQLWFLCSCVIVTIRRGAPTAHARCPEQWALPKATRTSFPDQLTLAACLLVLFASQLLPRRPPPPQPQPRSAASLSVAPSPTPSCTCPGC